MLTKSLIRTRTDGVNIKPIFLKAQDKKTLDFCEALLQAAHNAVGELKTSLEEELSLLCSQSPVPLTAAQGLAHVVLENTQVKEEPRGDKIAFRAAIFATSNALLQEGDLDLLTFQHAISIAHGKPFGQLAEELYSDLQHFARIERVKDSFGPHQLVHRYNCAQVQGLLLNSVAIDLHIPDHTSGHVRHLLRYMKFFQLLCTARPVAQGLHLTIDGPGAILGQGARYGLKLAQFFPTVLSVPKWTLTAKILVSAGARKELPKILTLNEGCGIRSHYPPSCSQVAPEVTACLSLLTNKHPQWVIETESAHPIVLTNGDLLVPDFCLVHSSGKKVFFEIFQEWQSGPATRRIRTLADRTQEKPIVLVLPIKLKNLSDVLDISPISTPPWAVLYRKSLLPDPIVKAAQKALDLLRTS